MASKAPNPELKRQPIQLLQESAILKIAAGEVIERPASIVKELVENSLDAQARQIDIQIVDGGLTSIVVRDDGCGIPADETSLALQRHATSKLANESELTEVSTLGFRGEALASVAAVSHLELVTRTADASNGIRIQTEAGQITRQEPIGVPVGTTVSVSNLFFNAPARKKFLRSKVTEKGHIEKAIRRLALLHTECSFLFETDGKTILNLPKTKTLLERAEQLYPKEISSTLLQFSGSDSSIRVSGLISSSQISFARPSEIWVFVNTRPIQDRMLNSAVLEGFRTALMEHRYPLAAVVLELKSTDVDINVHPTKMQVRFSDPQRIFHLVSKSIANTVKKDMGKLSSTNAPYPPEDTSSTLSLPYSMESHPFEDKMEAVRTSQALYGESAIQKETSGQGFFSTLQFLDHLDNTYLICKNTDSLVLIDQHAAHERVRFEWLKKAWEHKNPESQRLLIPITLEPSMQRFEAIKSLQSFLTDVGFELEPFGEKTYILRAVPVIFEKRDPRLLLMDLADEVSQKQGSIAWQDQVDHILSQMACHSAVRAHDLLSTEEVRTLLKQMDEVDLSQHCPHGRPTFLTFDISKLERFFKRT